MPKIEVLAGLVSLLSLLGRRKGLPSRARTWSFLCVYTTLLSLCPSFLFL